MSEALPKDVPMPLDVAIRECFPFGGVTLSTLRTEARKGRLAIERIGGKDYVTKAAIEEMRRLCRVRAKDQDSISSGKRDGPPSTSFGMDRAQLARDVALSVAEKLRKRSARTSEIHSGPIQENVISLKSKSRKS